MLTLITPTGDRPQAFATCEELMSRQTYRDQYQWIVVDDGLRPTVTTMGQEYLRRDRKPSDPQHTLPLQLLAALPAVRGDKVLIIEDDDGYSREYLEIMSAWLDRADLVGERGAKYYYLLDQAYYHWVDHRHASLCRTGLRASVLPTLETAARGVGRSDPKVDMRLWDSWRGSRLLVDSPANGKALCVGVKQMPGRNGSTWFKLPSAVNDAKGLPRLREWLGDNFDLYEQFVWSRDVVLYTCCFGGYDDVGPAESETRCVALIDGEDVPTPSGWERLVISTRDMSPKRASRYYKTHSHDLFPGEDTVYLDANVRLKVPLRVILGTMLGGRGCVDVALYRHGVHKTVDDEARAVLRLRFGREERVRTPFVQSRLNDPAFFGGFLFRRATAGTQRFNEEWWKLFQDHDRDQLVLYAALERSGAAFTAADIPTPMFGRQSPHFALESHRKARTAD